MRYYKEAINGPDFLGYGNHLPTTRLIPLLLVFFTLFCHNNANAQNIDEPLDSPPSNAQASEQQPSTSESLKTFTHDYWQQRFTKHAERVNWHDYQLQIEVTIPDAAAKLSPCSQEYQIEASSSALPVGQQRLRLRCPDTPGWTVMTRSQISVVMPVVIARIALEPEHYLQQSDLLLAPILLTAQHSDVLTDLEQAQGRRPQRALRPGQPVRNRMLKAALFVRKGDKVRLEMTVGEVSMSMQGIALQDGQQGETISVRNERSGKVISAQVTGVGQLTLSGAP